MSNGDNAKFVQSGQLSASNRGFNRSQVTNLSFGSIVEARKLRESRENDVRKLHNRIALLQSEEEKALKRIEETRAKAQQMLELKIIQEENARERMTNKAKALEKAREIVSSKKEQQLQVRERVEISLLKKVEMAKMVKEEKKALKKKISKNERNYLKKAQEKRFEQQVMAEASKIKQEQTLVNRLEHQRMQKNEVIGREGKIILKKEREVKKLEILESEVLKRLRDTHIK